VGRRIRERLGVTLEQQARWREPNNTFRGWRDAIEQAGVLVFVLSGAHHQVELEEMRGFAIAEQPLPAIVVNGKDRSPGKGCVKIGCFSFLDGNQLRLLPNSCTQ
jgi:hypothetical protein